MTDRVTGAQIDGALRVCAEAFRNDDGAEAESVRVLCRAIMQLRGDLAEARACRESCEGPRLGYAADRAIKAEKERARKLITSFAEAHEAFHAPGADDETGDVLTCAEQDLLDYAEKHGGSNG